MQTDNSPSKETMSGRTLATVLWWLACLILIFSSLGVCAQTLVELFHFDMPRLYFFPMFIAFEMRRAALLALLLFFGAAVPRLS